MWINRLIYSPRVYTYTPVASEISAGFGPCAAQVVRRCGRCQVLWGFFLRVLWGPCGAAVLASASPRALQFSPDRAALSSPTQCVLYSLPDTDTHVTLLLWYLAPILHLCFVIKCYWRTICSCVGISQYLVSLLFSLTWHLHKI